MTAFDRMPGWADLVVAATPAPKPYDPSKVEPGLIGLAFFLVMAGAVVFLVMSMRKRLGGIDVERHQREQDARKQAQLPPDGGVDGD